MRRGRCEVVDGRILHTAASDSYAVRSDRTWSRLIAVARDIVVPCDVVIAFYFRRRFLCRSLSLLCLRLLGFGRFLLGRLVVLS